MMVLVTYDVNTETAAGKRRLRRVAKRCQDFGQRVQHSVFECVVDPEQLVRLKDQLLSIVDEERDSLRIYHLGKNWVRRVEHFGIKAGYDPEGPLLI